MKRRAALKSLALVVGGTLTLPAWASGWSTQSIAAQPGFPVSVGQELLLAEIAETIIPKTNTPGAKELGVHKFILTMLRDCYEKTEQDRFLTGLTELESSVQAGYGKSFVNLDATQKLEVLKARENAVKILPTEKSPFFPYLKNLVIQGYMNSEYVMKEITKYELVPGRYHGCVPVTASAKK